MNRPFMIDLIKRDGQTWLKINTDGTAESFHAQQVTATGLLHLAGRELSPGELLRMLRV